NLLGGDALVERSLKPEVMADAAHVILTRPSREFTGNFCIDDEVLESVGITDLSKYQVNPDVEPAPDFFVEPKAR
ncbi:MAG: short chain dehydrogenase, partial [Pseudomonadota bacterium]